MEFGVILIKRIFCWMIKNFSLEFYLLILFFFDCKKERNIEDRIFIISNQKLIMSKNLLDLKRLINKSLKLRILNLLSLKEIPELKFNQLINYSMVRSKTNQNRSFN